MAPHFVGRSTLARASSTSPQRRIGSLVAGPLPRSHISMFSASRSINSLAGRERSSSRSLVGGCVGGLAKYSFSMSGNDNVWLWKPLKGSHATSGDVLR